MVTNRAYDKNWGFGLKCSVRLIISLVPWLSGNALISINTVALFRAWLVYWDG